MTKNVGKTDKAIRLVAAVILLVIGLVADIGTVLKVIVFALATINLLTALFGTCPLYSALGISTDRKSK